MTRAWAEAFLAEWTRPYYGPDAGDPVAAVLRAVRVANENVGWRAMGVEG